MRQERVELKGEVNTSTLILGDCNTCLSVTDRSSRQKISKDTDELNGSNSQLDLIHIRGMLH